MASSCPQTVLKSEDHWVSGLETWALHSCLLCHQVEYYMHTGEIGVSCHIEIACKERYINLI